MRLVVFGAGLAGMKAWIALTQLPAVEVVAFLDNDPKKRDTCLFGTPVRSVSALGAIHYDAVLIASLSANDIRRQLLAQGVPESMLHVVDPGRDLGTQLLSRGMPVGRRRTLRRCPAWRVGIFGAGAAGLQAWESLAPHPCVDVVAFLDNDRRRQQSRFLGVPVMSPHEIDVDSLDAVVVASVHANEMIAELLDAGVPADRVFTVELFRWFLRVGRPGISALQTMTAAALGGHEQAW